MSTLVVVGGGITGIFSALYLRTKYDKVYLIEKSDKLGGLLQSSYEYQQYSFDFGTHFISDTGIEDIDNLLFKEIRLDKNKWKKMDYLKSANFFNGNLNETSSCIKTSVLSEEIYNKGIIEMLEREPSPKVNSNLKEQLNTIYGETFTEYIFKPVLNKLFGCRLEELAPDAYQLFIPKRLIALNPNISREMKKIPLLDDKLAYHSYLEGIAECKSYYPKDKGISEFIAILREKMEQMGIVILTNETIANISHVDANVSRVTLQNSKNEIGCSHIVWTVPMFALFKLLDINLIPQSPVFRRTTLYHFLIDTPFATDAYYVTCYDPNLNTFRATLYSNVVKNDGEQKKLYRCTVEVISDGTTQVNDKIIFNELKDMGIVDKSASIMHSHVGSVATGFPILTTNFVNKSKEQLQILENNIKNISFVGQSRGTSFFMKDILMETFRILSEKVIPEHVSTSS